MRNRMPTTIGVFSLAFLAPVAHAAATLPGPVLSMPFIDEASGEIVKVDLEKNYFQIRHADADMTIVINEKTIFTINGKEAKPEEALKKGHAAVVTHEGRVAIRVDVTTSMLFIDEVSGEIVKVDLEKNYFQIRHADADMTIVINEKTVFTINGKEAKREEALKKGHTAVVKHEGRIATRVDVTTSP